MTIMTMILAIILTTVSLYYRQIINTLLIYHSDYIYSNGPKLRICFWKRSKSTRRLRFSVAQYFIIFFFWLIVTICRVYASKWLFRKFYEYFLDFLLNVGTRGLRISLQHGLEDVAAVLVIYANLPNLPCSPPSSPQIINTWRSF